MTLLEGRDACEFKLHAPLKFWTGRSDCVSLDADGHGYKVIYVSNFILVLVCICIIPTNWPGKYFSKMKQFNLLAF